MTLQFLQQFYKGVIPIIFENMEFVGCVLSVFLVLLPMCEAGKSVLFTVDELVDLTNTYRTNKSMYFPGYPYGYSKSTQFAFYDAETGIWNEANGIMMSIHSGTHMDAPCHVTNREDVDRFHEVPISRFFGPAAVIDIKAKVDEDDYYELSMDDLNAWEEKNGRVPDGAIVLVHTGWAKKYFGDTDKYYGTANATHVDFRYPGVSQEVAEFLVENRNIDALGIDTGSPDGPKNVGTWEVHTALLGNNRLIIENVAATLEQLPPTGYSIHAVPLKLYDTCGSPLRVLAFKAETSGAPAVAGTAWAYALGMLAFLVL